MASLGVVCGITTMERSTATSAPLERVTSEPFGELEMAATANESEHALGAAAEPLADLPLSEHHLERADALDAFYTKLAARLRGEPGVVRVAHYGDSLIAADFLAGTARRELQKRFGDGGSGFLPVAAPSEWSFHNDVTHFATSGWHQSRVTGPTVKGGAYGPAGVVFRGGAGASATFATARDGEFGRNVSLFQLAYLARPGGGAIELKTGEGTRVLETEADAEHVALEPVAVADGQGKLTVRVLRGEVRLFGVALERAEGLVYDAYGLVGAKADAWQHMRGPHWREAYDVRPPALVAVQFGTNESMVDPEESYAQKLAELLQRWKEAAPGASLVLMAPPDRAVRNAAGELHSHRGLGRIVETQREVARLAHVAFFDTPAAMGGEDAMVHWVTAHPALGSTDLIHPTNAGGVRLGQLFVRGLAGGYAEWRVHHEGAPVWAP